MIVEMSAPVRHVSWLRFNGSQFDLNVSFDDWGMGLAYPATRPISTWIDSSALRCCKEYVVTVMDVRVEKD